MNNGTLEHGIEVPHAPELNTLSMTMAAWFYITATENALLIGKCLHPSGDGYAIMIQNNQLVFLYTTNSFRSAYREAFPFQLSTWFWAGMSINNNGQGYVTINGTAYEFRRPATFAPIANQQPFRIGSLPNVETSITGLTGKISHVVLYSRSVPIEDLRSIMEASE